MASDDMATMPIRDLIAGLRKQVDELPRERFLDQLVFSVIATRFEKMADENDDLKTRHDELQLKYDNALSLWERDRA